MNKYTVSSTATEKTIRDTEAAIRAKDMADAQKAVKTAQNALQREKQAYIKAGIKFHGRQLRGSDVKRPPHGPLRSLWETMYTLYCGCCTDPNRYGLHNSDLARRSAGLPNAAYTRCYFELDGNEQPDW